MNTEPKEMSFEETRLVAEKIFQTIAIDRADEEIERYSKSEIFSSLTEEQKCFFVKCIRDSVFEGARHCLYLFDGNTTLSDGGDVDAVIEIRGKKTSFISEHFSSIGEERDSTHRGEGGN
jgi:hypothetical protein